MKISDFISENIIVNEYIETNHVFNAALQTAFQVMSIPLFDGHKESWPQEMALHFETNFTDLASDISSDIYKSVRVEFKFDNFFHGMFNMNYNENNDERVGTITIYLDENLFFGHKYIHWVSSSKLIKHIAQKIAEIFTHEYFHSDWVTL